MPKKDMALGHSFQDEGGRLWTVAPTADGQDILLTGPLGTDPLYITEEAVDCLEIYTLGREVLRLSCRSEAEERLIQAALELSSETEARDLWAVKRRAEAFRRLEKIAAEVRRLREGSSNG